jgi:GNAT superfamily N-acetyltransferase
MIIRKAAVEDRSGILEVAAQIWEGHDYVPQILDRWLAEGGLWVAELEGRVAGSAKTSILSPGEFWFEGLRVALAYRNRGVARALAEAQVEDALAQGARSIRYSTAEINQASIRIAHALGFREIARFTLIGGPVGQGAEGPGIVRAADPDRVAEFIFGSATYRENHGLLPHGWIFKDLSETVLAELVKEGAVFYTETRGEVRGALVLLPTPYRLENLAIALLDGDGETLRKLTRFAHHYGRERGHEELRAMASSERLVQALTEAGLFFELNFRYALVFEHLRR